MRTKLTTLLFLMLMCVQAAIAQTSVTGQVLDENAEPLIGASVMVKNAKTGVPTDLDGNFTLNVSPG